MLRCIQFEKEKKCVKDFLRLPKQLYRKDTNMEDSKEVRQLLQGIHPLSRYFTLHKFLVYREREVVGRFALTTYPKDDVMYIGFFECVNDEEVAKLIFCEAEKYAKKLGYLHLVGPVDASFWHKYRLKINHFESIPYTGEPYNLDYYFDMFHNNGFVVCQHYVSNIYNKVESEEPLYDGRFNKFREMGYRIISPDVNDFDIVIRELYELLTELYKDFPIYKELSYEDFYQVFSSYRYILNMNMVKMAYYKKKAVGFFVGVPDYGNRVYHLNRLGNLLKVFSLKKTPMRYVMLYIGVDKAHRGLGKALIGSVMEELRQCGLPCVGALAQDGKVTQKYGEEHIEQCYEYVLMEKRLEQ